MSTALVAPVMLTPPRRHWNENGPVPSTPTASVAVLPTLAVTLAGCVTIDGATAAGALADTVKAADVAGGTAGAVAHGHAITTRIRARHGRETQHRIVGARDVRAVEAPLITQRFRAMRRDGEHGVIARGHAERGRLRRDARCHVEIAHGHGRIGTRRSAQGVGRDYPVLLAVVRRRSRRGGVVSSRGAGAGGHVGPIARGVGGAGLPLQRGRGQAGHRHHEVGGLRRCGSAPSAADR